MQLVARKQSQFHKAVTRSASQLSPQTTGSRPRAVHALALQPEIGNHLVQRALQTKPAANTRGDGDEQPDEAGQTKAPPLVQEVLRSPGQPLDTPARAFMEARLGHDFGQVRIHEDKTAAQSARSVRALAYTVGHHIVFREGQYSPATASGKRLLAHELVHTMQHGNNLLRRKVSFTDPTPTLSDPIPLVLGGSTLLGNTRPGLNGTLLPAYAIKKDYKEAVFKALEAQTFSFSDQKDAKACKVDPDKYNINVYAQVRAITEPRGKKWSGTYQSIMLNNPPAACTAKGEHAIQVEMEGNPDGPALYRKVLAHEQEHVDDLKRLTTEELKPVHDTLIGLKGAGKTEQECVANLYKQVGDKDALAAANFVDKWLAAVQVYDKPSGTHHSKFNTTVNPECTRLEIKERR